jgi:hypothetical protein
MKGSQGFVIILVTLAILNIAVTLPALLLSEPVPEGEFSQPLEGIDAPSQHVLLIVLDGVPTKVFDDNLIMPFMSQFEKVGAKVDVQASLMTLTGPCVKEMSTGREAANIDALRNWNVNNDGKDDPFHYALDRGDSVAFTGFYVWSNLFTDSSFVHETVDDHGFSDIYQSDDEALAIVETWVDSEIHDLMVAHLGGTDHAGHIYGIDSDIYAQRMNKLDLQLEAIFSSLPDDWTMLITADHGMSDTGGHVIGTGSVAQEVYLFAGGAGITPGYYDEEIRQRDISGLITVLLDLPLAASSEARIPTMLLNLDEQTKTKIEHWNWNATVAHHQWRLEQGLLGQSLSEERVDWELGKIDHTSIPWLAIVVAAGSMCIVGWRAYRSFESPNVEDVIRSPWFGSIVLFSFIIVAINSFAYEWQIGAGVMRMVRKLSGLFPLMAFTAFFLTAVFSQHLNKRFAAIPGWVPVMVLISLMFNPDIRWTAILIPFSVVAGLYMFNQRSHSQSRRLFIGIIPLLFLVYWNIIDYLPRVITGQSLSGLTGFHALYKISQVLVLNFMPVHFFSASAIILLFMLLLRDNSIDGRNPLRMKDSWLPLIILLCAWIENSWIDRILILGMALIFMQSLKSKSAFDLDLPWTNGEVIALLFIVPTWGTWPAMSVILAHRSIPTLMNGYRTSVSKEHTSFQNEIIKIMPAALLFSSAAFVWFIFAQLTPFGILEFNPSKVIVTGGFFGARTSPAIIWMTLMIGGPLLASIGLLHSRWGTEGLLTERSTFYLALILFSQSAMFWLGAIYPSTLQMLGPALIIYFGWIMVWICCEKWPKDIVSRHLGV